jgi:ADP-heptose:LPS heptosyltransferase
LHDSKSKSYDFHGEIMSIPWVLQLSVQDLSGAPYLRVMPEKMMQMAAFKDAQLVQSQKRFTIGLRWVSNVDRTARAMSLKEFEPLSQMPLNIVGLHYGPLKDQDRARYQGWSNFYPTELIMEDLAGLMMHLDCVVTCDTMTAHLAGALGRPTILLKPVFINWRWGNTGDQSIWYDSIQIIRQEQFRDWSGAIEQLQLELQKRMSLQ